MGAVFGILIPNLPTPKQVLAAANEMLLFGFVFFDAASFVDGENDGHYLYLARYR